MKLLREIVPIVLAIVILLGGYAATPLIRRLMPDYVDRPVAYEKPDSRQLFTATGEQLTIYPWNRYQEDNSLIDWATFTTKVEEKARSAMRSGVEKYIASTLTCLYPYNLLDQDPRPADELFDHLSFSEKDQLLYLRDAPFEGGSGRRYLLNMAFYAKFMYGAQDDSVGTQCSLVSFSFRLEDGQTAGKDAVRQYADSLDENLKQLRGTQEYSGSKQEDGLPVYEKSNETDGSDTLTQFFARLENAVQLNLLPQDALLFTHEMIHAAQYTRLLADDTVYLVFSAKAYMEEETLQLPAELVLSCDPSYGVCGLSLRYNGEVG